MSNIYAPHFQDETEARRHLEALRWPHGVECAHCESDNVTEVKGGRDGLYQCNTCRKQFTVTVGTVFERSKVKLHKWLLATHLMCASKKGISAHQLHRTIGVTYKTAWFMAHRIREAMKEDGGPLGGAGHTVEADETYIGKKAGPKSRTAIRNMNKVVSLVDRVTGRSVSFHVTEELTADSVSGILFTNIDRQSRLHTDEAHFYKRPGRDFARHESVSHARKEYVRGDVTTNTIEGFFGIFKRGMKGIYQHCAEKHLHRYVSEFAFRQNTAQCDTLQFIEMTAARMVGKRLTYKALTNG